MPKTLKISDLESVLGTSKASRLVEQIQEARRSTYQALTKDTVRASARYHQWLSTRGKLPAGYSPKQRRHDRISWMRAAERLILGNKQAQQLLAAYLLRAEKQPEDVRVPCPECSSPQLLHGLDIHLSRVHGIRGPHYPGKR